MNHRIRLAMQTKTFEKLSGAVEVDETYIGPEPRYMHASKRQALRDAGILGKGGLKGKSVVIAAKERQGDVVGAVIESTDWDTLEDAARDRIEPGSTVYTDAHGAYRRLTADYDHQYIDHATGYVSGQVHTNGLENFFALFKRGLSGTYVSVAPEHLSRYLDEQIFRFNKREADDAGRFARVVSSVPEKRLTYQELTNG